MERDFTTEDQSNGRGIMGKVAVAFHNVNKCVNTTTFGRMFRLKGCGHPDEIADANFTTEIRAGLTTFATMAYIIAVNASILSDSGGPCHCEKPDFPDLKCTNLDEFLECKWGVHRDLITATSALAGLASIVFGFLTNLPVALGPGMGLNAYFTYQVVGVPEDRKIPYGLALTAVFVEGFIFMFLALTGMRQWLVRIIPGTLKTASGVGIGLLLTLVGLSYSTGIGLVVGGTSTPLTLAGCGADQLSKDTGLCQGHLMSNPKLWLGIVGGGLFTAWLMAFRVKAAMIIGIGFVAILSWPRNTPVTFFPDTPDGNERFRFFKQVVAFNPIQHTLNAQIWDLRGPHGSQFALALFTFLYVDIIDCTATLYSMARFSGKTDPKTGNFPRSTIAYCTDAAFISIGSLLGCSPVTAFVESGAGIAEGGRTGLTAIVTGVCFLISVFFAPILASIPPWATGCTLILVGCLMIRQVTCINWRYIGDAIPSFATMALIPFTYSVAYGLIGGIFIYAGLNSLIWLVMFLSRGRVLPSDYDEKEYWTCKPTGEKPWFIRQVTNGRFWTDDRRRSKDEMELNEITDPTPDSRAASASSHEEKGLEPIATPRRSVLSRD